MTVSSGIQFNEGNIQQSLKSPLMSQEAKIELVRALPLIIHPPKQPTETSSKTTYAAGATGPNAVLIKTQSTGTDKIVDKIAQNADTIKDVANTVVQTTGDVANTVVETTGESVTTSVIASILATKWLLIVVIIAIIIIIFLLVLLIQFIINHLNKRKIVAAGHGGVITISGDVPENQFLSETIKK